VESINVTGTKETTVLYLTKATNLKLKAHPTLHDMDSLFKGRTGSSFKTNPTDATRLEMKLEFAPCFFVPGDID